MTDEIKQAILLLEENGYKVTQPPKQVKDEYTFARAWDLYQKKVGCKEKLEKKWNSMSQKDRKAAIEYIPLYVISQPDKQYRKNFQTFLNQRAWHSTASFYQRVCIRNQSAYRQDKGAADYRGRQEPRSSPAYLWYDSGSSQQPSKPMPQAVGDIS